MGSGVKIVSFLFLLFVVFTLIVPALKRAGIFKANTQGYPSGTVVVPIYLTPEPSKQNLQLYTFPFITATPTPIPSNKPVDPGTGGAIPVTQPKIGGPSSPSGYYCIDDVNASGCDDSSSFLVPKGTGGAGYTCGTVIENAHKLVAALPQDIKYGGATSGFPEGLPRDRLGSAISTSCHSTGPYVNGYLSTYFVIDAYNLAGFSELSKTNPQHVDANSLMTWWKANNPGYFYVPYTAMNMQKYASGQINLTGCVMFMKFPSGVFSAIVNTLEVYNQNGDGVLSVLHSNAIFYLDRFVVAGWAVQNTLEHSAGSSKSMINGIDGFGCHM